MRLVLGIAVRCTAMHCNPVHRHRDRRALAVFDSNGALVFVFCAVLDAELVPDPLPMPVVKRVVDQTVWQERVAVPEMNPDTVVIREVEAGIEGGLGLAPRVWGALEGCTRLLQAGCPSGQNTRCSRRTPRAPCH